MRRLSVSWNESALSGWVRFTLTRKNTHYSSSLCKHLPLSQGTPWYKVSCDIFMGKTFLNGIFSPKMGTMQVWEGLKLCTHKRGRNIKFCLSVSLCLPLCLSYAFTCVHIYTHSFSSSPPSALLPCLCFSSLSSTLAHSPPGPSLIISPSLSLSLCFHLSYPVHLLSFSHFLSLSLSPSCSKERLSFFDFQVLFLTFLINRLML